MGKYKLSVEWENAVFPNPLRAKIEHQYARSLLAYVGGSVDTLKAMFDVAKYDINNHAKQQDVDKVRCLAKMNAFSGLGFSVPNSIVDNAEFRCRISKSHP